MTTTTSPIDCLHRDFTPWRLVHGGSNGNYYRRTCLTCGEVHRHQFSPDTRSKRTTKVGYARNGGNGKSAAASCNRDTTH